MESERFVLDSYALLAFLEGESSGEEIERLFRQASAGRCRLLMSVVNLGEVLYITERERGLNKVHGFWHELMSSPSRSLMPIESMP